MTSNVRVKRRVSGGSSAPASLSGGELAVDETTTIPTLYYGKGNDGSGVATSIVKINQPSFADHTDASISSPASGNVLKYNGTAWANSSDWTGNVVPGTYGGTGVNNSTRTITIGGNFTTSGAFTTTLTVTGNTNVTLPTSGTLVNSAVTTLSSLVSIGTVTTGTWNATVVTGTYGGTGVNNGTKTITLGGNFTTSGAFTTTLTVTGNTNVTLPTSGTLVNTAVTTLSSLVSVGTITTGTWSATTIAVDKGGTGLTSGTSGGIPYYSASTTMASSAALAAKAVVLGGGAGAAPSTNANLTYDGTTLLLGGTSSKTNLGFENQTGFNAVMLAGTSFWPSTLYYRSRGTIASPTDISAGDSCGAWLGYGYYNSQYNNIGSEFMVAFTLPDSTKAHAIKSMYLNNLASDPIQRESLYHQKDLSDAVSKDLASFSLATITGGGAFIDYCIECRNASSVQVETGKVVISLNRVSTTYNNGVSKITGTTLGKATSGTTLTVTFAVSAADPAVVSVSADTSLTSLTYFRITYSIYNFGSQSFSVPA